MKDSPSKKQLELNSLIEFSQLINSNLNLEFILGNILLSIMGKMLITRGMFIMKDHNHTEDKRYIIKALKGISYDNKDKIIFCECPKEPVFTTDSLSKNHEFFVQNGIKYFFKTYFINKLTGILCIGKKLNNKELSKDDIIFIETLLNLSAPTIENSLQFEEIKKLNINLSSRLQQLQSLFELSKEFNSNFQDKEKIIKLLKYTLLGNFGIKDILMLSKFRSDIFYNVTPETNIDIDPSFIEELKYLREPEILSSEHKGNIKELLYKKNFRLIIPILSNNEPETIVCVGYKLNKTEFTLSDIKFLESLINLSVISIDNTLLFNEFIEKQRIENELKIAREIQLTLLPKSIPKLDNFDIYAINIPALHVGGDYYDIIKLDDTNIALAIADVSGKGTPASLLMANIQSAVHSFLKFYDNNFDLSAATIKINDLIYNNTSSEKFITFFWSILDVAKDELIYVNAGHNHPLLINSSNNIIKLDQGGLMLGVIDDCIRYDKGIVKLNSGDIVFFYTDGLTESINNLKEEFGEERLIQLLKENSKENAETIVKNILNDLDNFTKGEKQFDDITIICLKKV